MNYYETDEASKKSRIAFKSTLDDLLLLKPEHVTNPYKKSLGNRRTHNVSDSIDRINQKLEDEKILHDEFLCIDNEEIASHCVQLTFDFE